MKHVAPDEHRRFARQQRVAMTSAEAALWHKLRAGRFQGFKFKRQVPYASYVADFSCASARVNVEVDGAVHDTDEQRAHDAARDRWFAKRGFRVLRLANEMVLDAMEFVLIEIESALRAGTPLSRPSLTRGSPSP